MAALIERFELVMGSELMPEKDPGRHFDVEKLRLGYKEHLRLFGLNRETDYPFFGGRRQQRTVIERPAFTRCVFLVAPPVASEAEASAAPRPQLKELDFYSVPNSSLAHVMVKNGYEVINVIHLPNAQDKLPPPLDQQRRSGAPRQPAAADGAAPLELRVPSKVVAFDKAGTAPTVASQLVEQFELRVVATDSGNKQQV